MPTECSPELFGFSPRGGTRGGRGVRRWRDHLGCRGAAFGRGRYGVYHDLDAWRRYMSVAGFVELSHYYRPAGVPRERQPWLASVWRRLEF